jgi:alkaline phosphatase D
VTLAKMQQVVFGKVNYTSVGSGSTDLNFDGWEGYRYEKNQIVGHLKDNKISEPNRWRLLYI